MRPERKRLCPKVRVVESPLPTQRSKGEDGGDTSRHTAPDAEDEASVGAVISKWRSRIAAAFLLCWSLLTDLVLPAAKCNRKLGSRVFAG